MTADVEISTAQAPDIEDIAKIHLAALPESFLAQLGEGYLKTKLYPKTIFHNTTITLVAKQKHEPAGFIQFTSDSKSFEVFLTQSRSSEIVDVLKGILKSPWILRDILSMLGSSKLKIESPKWDSSLVSGELFTIAIKPEFHRKGIGLKLVSEGLKRLFSKSPDLRQCLVKTHNEEGIKFYESCGFTRIGQELRGKTAFIILGIRRKNA